jgi:hypothetical protein
MLKRPVDRLAADPAHPLVPLEDLMLDELLRLGAAWPSAAPLQLDRTATG